VIRASCEFEIHRVHRQRMTPRDEVGRSLTQINAWVQWILIQVVTMSYRRCIFPCCGVLAMTILCLLVHRLEAGDLAVLEAGKRVYDQHCAACHGTDGDGNGPAAVWLFPKPRDFSAGLYKIQSTPAGSLPSDADLYRSISQGLGGSSMPAFHYLSEQELLDVVEYVKLLTAVVGPDGRRVNRFEEAAANGTLGDPITVPPEPPLTFDSITRGQEVYGQMQCNSCHGETGAGDGPSAPTLKDSLGVVIHPRDFNTDLFRGGSTGQDLYTRIAVGLGGTPMVAYPDEILTPSDRWALVHYIQSLRRKDVEVGDILASDGVLPVARVKGDLPLDPMDPAWERVESVRVPLNPLWPEPYPITGVTVRALHNGKVLAVLLQWRDDILDGAPVRVEDFQDAAALQFSLTDQAPFLGMGDPANPVNVWQWKAGWQQDTDGERPDVDLTYPAMHVDTYQEPELHGLYRTAETAGNLLAFTRMPSPVEDANAMGFGTMTSQPPSAQNVGGKGIWRDGFWNVLFHRELESRDSGDVNLTPGESNLVAFAIWNGAQRDRNGRKVFSNWHSMILNP
jgi:mono/diheme cytochrome c family protein